MDLSKLGLHRPKRHSIIPTLKEHVSPPLASIVKLNPHLSEPTPEPAPSSVISSTAPSSLLDTHKKTLRSRALVLYKKNRQHGRKERRKEVDRLQEDWRGSYFFRRLKYEPVLEDYGSSRSGGKRESRRLYWRRLLTAN